MQIIDEVIQGVSVDGKKEDILIEFWGNLIFKVRENRINQKKEINKCSQKWRREIKIMCCFGS